VGCNPPNFVLLIQILPRQAKPLAKSVDVAYFFKYVWPGEALQSSSSGSLNFLAKLMLARHSDTLSRPPQE
jgi:hypothetical protein